MAKKQAGASIRIVGSQEQIHSILATFEEKGFTWRSSEYFYPRIGQPDLYSYYLENFEHVIELSCKVSKNS